MAWQTKTPQILVLPKISTCQSAVILPKAEPSKRGALMLATESDFSYMGKSYSASYQDLTHRKSNSNLKGRTNKTALPKIARV